MGLTWLMFMQSPDHAVHPLQEQHSGVRSDIYGSEAAEGGLFKVRCKSFAPFI